MLQPSSSLLSPPKPPPPLSPPPATHRRFPNPVRQRPLLAAASPLASHGGVAAAAAGVGSHAHERHLHNLRPPVEAGTSVGLASSCPGRNLGLRSLGPELGLLSLVLVISMVIGSFFAVAVISLPAMGALSKLSTAMDRLSRVVAEEVPGSLLSLKLSGREINELTQQLSSLRRIISGNRDHGKEDRMKKSWSRRGGDDPLIV